TPTGSSFCNICAHEWSGEGHPPPNNALPTTNCEQRTADDEPRTANSEQRYASIDDLIQRTGLRRDELATLAEIGALNAFAYDRRSALWQIEKAVRPSGELF